MKKLLLYSNKLFFISLSRWHIFYDWKTYVNGNWRIQSLGGGFELQQLKVLDFWPLILLCASIRGLSMPLSFPEKICGMTSCRLRSFAFCSTFLMKENERNHHQKNRKRTSGTERFLLLSQSKTQLLQFFACENIVKS